MIFIGACLLLALVAEFGYVSPYDLLLDVQLIVAQPKQVYRLWTSPLICAGSWKGILPQVVGLHVGTWFVIAGTKGRWQKIITTYFYNYLMLCLLAYFVDPVTW